MTQLQEKKDPWKLLRDIVEYRYDKKPEDENIQLIKDTVDWLREQQSNQPVKQSINDSQQQTVILLGLLYHPMHFLNCRPVYVKSDNNDMTDQSMDTETNINLLTVYSVVQLLGNLQDNLYSLMDSISNLMKTQERMFLEMDLSRNRMSYALGLVSYLGYGLEIVLPNNCHFYPDVLSNQYILIRHLPLLQLFLSQKEKYVCDKGLTLGRKLVARIKAKDLKVSFLDLLKESPIDKSLIKIMKYSSIKSHRSCALSLFKSFVNCFDLSARYHLLYKTLADPDHEHGVQGLVLLMYKDYLVHESDPSPLFGNNLFQIINKSFELSLPQGVDSDLAENYDSIASLLNLIRYILLRDKCNVNATNIWSKIDSLKNNYIDKIWQAIKVSRARYKARLIELEQSKNSDNKKSENGGQEPLQVKILNSGDDDGEMLPELTEEYEKESLQLALVNMDLIESIVGRINDIIDEAHHHDQLA